MNCLKFLKILILYIIFATNSFAQNNNSITGIKKVVIDPGHGGIDPGALGKFSKEKDIVLSVALKLGNLIKKNYPELEVIYTRTTDEFIPLYQRAEIANQNKANLFISIHCNSTASSKNSYGVETWVLGESKAEENFEVAKKENSVILLEKDYTTRYEGFDPNSPESYILLSVMQRAHLKNSIQMAQYIQDNIKNNTNLYDRSVKQAGFLVLAKTAMPSVLVEIGFISNPEEEKYLNSEKGQDEIALSIFEAFKKYKNYVDTHTLPIIAENNNNNQSNNLSELNAENNSSNNLKSNNKDIIEFKVQILASKQPLPSSHKIFKEFDNVEQYFYNGYYKYTISSDTNYLKALENLKQIRKKVPDAFLIATKNGEIIPLNEINTTKK